MKQDKDREAIRIVDGMKNKWLPTYGGGPFVPYTRRVLRLAREALRWRKWGGGALMLAPKRKRERHIVRVRGKYIRCSCGSSMLVNQAAPMSKRRSDCREFRAWHKHLEETRNT